MEVVPNNTLLPGDPRLIEHIVCELKSQGIFDQFRKECIDDVDTKPAYQNLRQRVEGSVSGFLKTQAWRPDMNKNQLREMLRKNIYESGFLETGVERIVDQVVYPKINSVFLPQVEDVVYNFLGLEKPVRTISTINGPLTINTIDLLPTDLDPISPDSEVMDKSLNKSDKSNDETDKLDDSKNDEFESPPFEPITEQSVFSAHEESSNDSHLSGISGLTSHDSNMSSQDSKLNIFALDVANQDSQLSKVSSNSRLSIITTDSKHNSEKMDISDDTQTSKSSKLGEESNLNVEETTEKFENGVSHFNIKPEITDEIDAIRIEINDHQNGEKEEKNEEIKDEDQYDVEMDIDEDSQMSNIEEPNTLEEKTFENENNIEEIKKESLEKEMEELKMDVRVSEDSIKLELEKEFCEESNKIVPSEENISEEIEENGSKSGVEDAKTEDSRDSVSNCDLKVEDASEKDAALKKQESIDDCSKIEVKKKESSDDAAAKLEVKKQESSDDTSKLEVKKSDAKSERSRHDSERKHSSRYSESKDKKDERKSDKDRKEKDRNRSTSGSKDKDKYRDKSKDNRSKDKDTSKSKDDKSSKSKEDKESTKSSSKDDKSRSSSSSKYSRDRSNSKSDSKSSKDSKDRSESRSKTNSKSKDEKAKSEETKVSKSDDTKKSDSSKKTEDSKKESDLKKSSKSEDSKSLSKSEENKSSRSRDRSRSDTKHTSSSGSRDRKSSSSKDHKDRKEPKKSSKRDKDDDHSSSRDKKTDNRRSADRDSNDGSSGIGNNSNSNSSKEKESSSVKSSDNSTDSSQGSNSGDSGQSDNSQTSQCLNQNDDSSAIKAPVTIITDTLRDKDEITISPTKDSDSDTAQHVKIMKPKFASNIFEARRLMKVRKKLEKLEKKRQRQLVQGKTDGEGDCLSLEDTDSVDSGCLQIAEQEDSKEDLEIKNTTTDRVSLKDELNSTPTTSVVSKESWDALEAKLSLNVDYDSYIDENCDSSSSTKHPRRSSDEEDCLYFVPQTSPKIERYLKKVASLQRDGAQLAIVLEDCRKMAPPHMNSEVPTKRTRKTNQKYMIDEGESRETITSKKTTGVDGKNNATMKKKTKGRKRKLDGEMEGFYLDNNNKKTNHHFDVTDIVEDYEEVMEPSPSASNTSNGSVDLTTKIKPPARSKKAKKIQNETFPLPLSPESDVSASSIEVRNVAQEKEVTAPVRTPRASIKKSQRYSSDDLYKPRPFVSGSSRRQRGLLNSTDNVDSSAKLRR